MLSMGYSIELTKKAKDFICDKGYDANFGARPLNRAIQKLLEDPVAEEILKYELQKGDKLVADYDKEKDALAFNVEKKAPEEKETKNKKK